MNCKTLLFCMAATTAAVMTEPQAFAFEREKPEKYWNTQELFKAPSFRDSGFEDSKYEGMRDIMVSGYGPNGTKAEFFAYVAMPTTPKPEGGYPGIVLVHGGGGTAYLAAEREGFMGRKDGKFGNIVYDKGRIR